MRRPRPVAGAAGVAVFILIALVVASLVGAGSASMAAPSVTVRNGVRIHTDIPGPNRYLAGAGPDLFIFTPGGGHNSIDGFNPAEDRIELRGFDRYRTFADIFPRIWSSPQGLFVGLNDRASIRVTGTHKGDLTSRNVIVR